MSADVLGQLQRISGQQSRIRDMKNKLAAFNEVLARQDAAFSELKVVHRCACGRRFAKTAGGGRLHATVSAVVTLTQTTQVSPPPAWHPSVPPPPPPPWHPPPRHRH